MHEQCQLGFPIYYVKHIIIKISLLDYNIFRARVNIHYSSYEIIF